MNKKSLKVLSKFSQSLLSQGSLPNSLPYPSHTTPCGSETAHLRHPSPTAHSSSQTACWSPPSGNVFSPKDCAWLLPRTSWQGTQAKLLQPSSSPTSLPSSCPGRGHLLCLQVLHLLGACTSRLQTSRLSQHFQEPCQQPQASSKAEQTMGASWVTQGRTGVTSFHRC